ncbi:MAG: M48 family metalloprotease [Acidobacteria bacterium]|nr:M48 family metalloprotease [Acidobacteriota bacterium]
MAEGSVTLDSATVLLAEGGRVRGDAEGLAGVKPGWWAEADGSFDERGRFLARRVKVREEAPGSSFADRVQRMSLTESSKLDGSDRIVTSPAIVEYVQKVGGSVVPPWAAAQAFYSFGIIRDPTLNAFALPNGSIYVHTGLLARLDNEAQLAIVLGHEVAHVTERHGQRQYKAGVSAFFPAQIGAVILGVQFGRRTSGVYPQFMVGLGLELGLSAAVNGYGRGLEDQADRVGLRYAVEAGYDPAEGPKIWVAFNDVEGDEGSVENFFYGNHSTNEVRKENLEAEIDRHYPAPPPAARRANDDVYETTMLDLIRENAVADFDLKRYHLAAKGFDRVLAHRPGDPVAHHYTGLIIVATDDSPDGAARAAAEFLRALAVAPDYAPAHRDLGRLYARTGQTIDAAAHLGRYLELAPEDATDRGDVEKELAALPR